MVLIIGTLVSFFAFSPHLSTADPIETLGPIVDLEASFDGNDIVGDFRIKSKYATGWGAEAPHFYVSTDTTISDSSRDYGFRPGGTWRELKPDWSQMTLDKPEDPDSFCSVGFIIPNPGLDPVHFKGVILATFYGPVDLKEVPDPGHPNNIDYHSLQETSFAAADFPTKIIPAQHTNAIVPIGLVPASEIGESSDVFWTNEPFATWHPHGPNSVDATPQVFVLDRHQIRSNRPLMGQPWQKLSGAFDPDYNIWTHTSRRHMEVAHSTDCDFIMIYCPDFTSTVQGSAKGVSGIIRERR